MAPPIDPNAKLHEVRPEEAPVAVPPANEPAPARPKRKRLVLWIGVAVAIAAAGGTGVHAWLTRGQVSTDDAQVEADVVALAPRVSGPVAALLVADDSHVKAGQPLFRIDDADYQVKVRQAEAELATARAQVVTSQAQASAAQAGLTRSQAEAERAKIDLHSRWEWR